MNGMDVRRSEALVFGEETLPRNWAVAESTQPAQPFINRALSILRRRKWMLILSVLGALVLGLVATLLMTPQYTATTTVEIQRENSGLVNVGETEAAAATFVDQEFYETQYGLLKSQTLAERVASSLRLSEDPVFFDQYGASGAEQWFEGSRVKAGASTRDQRVKAAGEILLAHFEVAPVRLSRLVDLHFTSPDPRLSQRVVDAWALNFIQLTLERKFGATSYARKFLEDRLAQLRTRIDESEQKLVDYAAREGIVNLPGAPATRDAPQSVERSIAADDLTILNQELAEATGDRIRLEGRLNSARQPIEALQNQAISSLRQRRAELAADYAGMMEQFAPQYPPAQALQRQIQQLDRSIAQEEGRVSGSLRESVDAARQREQALQQRVQQLKSGLLDLRRRSIQYNIFQRDVDTNRQLYDALLQRYKEIGVAGGVGVNNIAVVDDAELPVKPSSPNLPLNLAIALLAGTLLGAAGAFALEQLDQGIADPAEVETALGVPLLGTIPRTSGEVPTESLRDPKSSISEAYRSAHTNLGFTTDHGTPYSLAVTSSRPAEGKTTTSYALASMLARSNRRVLLIDADMRSPSIHHVLNVSNHTGLSNYLSGSDDIDTLLHPIEGYSNLSFMTAGPQPPSSPELLSSDRLPNLLDALRARFDHVILDVPPVMGIADAPLIGSQVEGMVFVIESHSTQRGMARLSVTRLLTTNANILGAVLTKFDLKRAHYGYGYDYGYGYSYGNTSSES